jgi:hypothetical protein
MKMSQRQKLSESIVDKFPPKDQWKDGRAYEIAEIAAHSFSSNGTQLIAAEDKEGKIQGLVSFYPDQDGVNITYIASTGNVHHSGTDLLKKAIDSNPGKDVNLYADPGAKTYYAHLGMHMVDDGGEGRGATFHWSSDEAAKFSSIPKETMNIVSRLLSMISKKLVHGGEGSGESEGHDFRGNQYGEGGSGSLKVTNDHKEYDTKLIKSLADGGGQKISDKIAQAQDLQLSKNIEYSEARGDQVGNYTGSGYVEINKNLRSGGPTTDAIYSKMDKVINESPEIPRGTVMYRGVGEHSAQRMMSMKPGDTCDDKAYQSFSTSPRVASTFTSYTETKGKRDAVIIRAVVDGKQRGFVVGHAEHEVIMPRGTKWKVVSNNAVTTGVNAGKVTTHMITVVPV